MDSHTKRHQKSNTRDVLSAIKASHAFIISLTPKCYVYSKMIFSVANSGSYDLFPWHSISSWNFCFCLFYLKIIKVVQRGKRRKEEITHKLSLSLNNWNLWEGLTLEKFMENWLSIIFCRRFSQETFHLNWKKSRKNKNVTRKLFQIM